MSSLPRRPWHLWVVPIVLLPWNAMGVFDFLMTQTRNEAYMAKFSPEQLEFFYGYPVVLVAFWAIAVWGALVGDLFLLFRRRLAFATLAISFLAMIVSSGSSYAFLGGYELMGAQGLVFSIVIFVVALLQMLYARAMGRRGLLR